MTFTRKLLSTAVLFSLSNFYVSAKEAPGSENKDLERIIVSGYRTANLAEIDSKRSSDGVMDAISQDQSGMLPDMDISQAAQRIAGVSTLTGFGVGSERSSNTSEAIVIRGLDPTYNLTTFDGVPIAATDQNDRRTKTSIFPSSVISQIQVIKTLTANLDPHGMSGQLNLVTFSAFDHDSPFLTTRASIGKNQEAGRLIADPDPNQRFDIAFSDKFGASEQFGFSLAGSYHSLSDSTQHHAPGNYDSSYVYYSADPSINEDVNLTDSNYLPAAARIQRFAFESGTKKFSGLAKLEYQPNDETYGYFYAGHFVQDEKEQRWEMLLQPNTDIRPDEQTATTGTWQEGKISYGYVNQPKEEESTIFTGHFEQWLNYTQKLRFDLSHSTASTHLLRDASKYNLGYSSDFAFDYDIDKKNAGIEFHNKDIVNDLSLYSSDYIRKRDQKMRNNVTYGAINYDHNFDGASGRWGFNAGIALTLRDQSFDRSYTQGKVFENCGLSDITDCELTLMDEFAFEKTTSGFNGVPFVLLDDQAARVVWEAQGSPLTTDRTDSSLQDDYKLTEDTYALFGQAVYRGDKLTVRSGLRYDTTDVAASLWQKDESIEKVVTDASQFVEVSRNSDYSYLLPSLVGSYHLQEDLYLRFGYGRTIGRPNFSHYAVGESVGLLEDGDDQITITQGNENLKPRVSDNYDLSLEYYFDQGSILSASYFYKAVDNMIYTRVTVDDTYQYEDQIITAKTKSPQNASDAFIEGIELSVRVDLANYLSSPFDGFILSSNVTLINSELTIVDEEDTQTTTDSWEQQPDFIANLSLSYDKGDIGANIAYNYVGDYLTSFDQDDTNNNVYREGAGQLDVQLRYNLTDNTKLLLEVQNLMDKNITNFRDIENIGLLRGSEVEKGRTFWLGITWVPNL
tara:strand:- start:2813 stop:5533 length:2721 start_codon:yes stop_codon:yes gene_type:complete